MAPAFFRALEARPTADKPGAAGVKPCARRSSRRKEVFPQSSFRGRRIGKAALLQALGCSILRGGVMAESASSHPTQSLKFETTAFSPEWQHEFAAGDIGCEEARGSFVWRPQGFGSNINNLLNAWVHSIAVENWSDMAVIIDSDQMTHIKCAEESGGQASSGWGCLFSPMAHLCTFESGESWADYMEAMDVSREDLEEASRLDQRAVRFHPEDIVASLEDLDVDHVGALAATAAHLWSNISPWLREDVDFITSVDQVFETAPYVGLHIRRGDKISNHEAEAIGIEEYLEAALGYLEEYPDRTSPDEIKGIWIASDDSTVVDKVRGIAHDYFPNVASEAIVYVSNGVPGGPEGQGTEMETRTNKQGYGAFAYMLADFKRLVKAEVFIGTFSSNVGRLMVVLREADGTKPRESAISVDTPNWWPGRD